MVDIFDFPEIAKEQQDDVEINDYKEKLQSYPLGDLQLYCDTSNFHPRPFVPKDARKPIFDTFHGLSHPTLNLIKSRYFWPGMNKQIHTWTKECLICQENKVHCHTKATITPFNLPSGRFETVHMDIVGPLPPETEMKPTQAKSDISLHVLTEPLVGLKQHL